mmetsp:Transcript_6742/g.9855  ORF Transcript_6742/g.9855 Transcript_6742/m.9855 type:complete len:729 (-) Transcript_6742:102-2288(-)
MIHQILRSSLRPGFQRRANRFHSHSQSSAPFLFSAIRFSDDDGGANNRGSTRYLLNTTRRTSWHDARYMARTPEEAFLVNQHSLQNVASTVEVMGTEEKFVEKKEWFPEFSKKAAVAPPHVPSSQRLYAVPAAWTVHLSIGAVYAYSMFTPSLTTSLGVVSNAPMDWSHAEVLPVFSAAAVTFGLTSAALGSWVEKVGPRQACATGALFWSGGLITSAVGVDLHMLPLVYAGYGLLGGIGWAMMYTAPTTSVMKWFPDKRGLATGMALSAFGAGAALAPGLIQALVDCFAVAPDFVGPLSDLSAATATGKDVANSFVELTTLPDGSQVVAETSMMGVPGQPVVVATETDVAKLSYVHTGPGAYALGTGDTGAGKAFVSLGLIYGVLGVAGSRFMQIPDPVWVPDSMREEHHPEEASPDLEETMVKETSKTPNDVGLPASYVATNTVQFPLLWVSVLGNSTGGLALLSSSKVMLTDIWAGIAPDLVTTSFATGYVSALGLGMAVGRFGWAAFSDYLGRQNTYTVFGLIGIPMMGMAPMLNHWAIEAASAGHSVAPLVTTFYAGSVLAISCYGGIFSVLPAYIADLFGPKYAGPILGVSLTAFATAAVGGPMGLAYLRSQSVDAATDNLLQTIRTSDPSSFEQAFGCSINDSEQISRLMDAKTLTIQRLVELAPTGTIDPTPFLYDSTCYAAAGMMGVAALANLMIRPINVREVEAQLEMKKATKDVSET